MSGPDRYAVMGNPIAHSKSPRIHTLFAGQTGQSIRYDAILVEKGKFAAAVEEFQNRGSKGLNVTVPFKEEAWALIERRTPRAELAGAVNTILFHEDGGRSADNTDGVGLSRDLTDNHGVTITGRRLLILGAGGAARGVVGPLLEQRPQELVVANRTVARAEALAERFAPLGKVEPCGFEALAGRRFDLVINATAASLEGALPPLPDDLLAEGAVCYDMMYGREETIFQRWAREHGAARALDGLGMLVEQAAEAFYLWRGVRPDTAPVIAALREE